MPLRDELVRRALSLMQDERVMKVLMDPRLVKLIMQAMGARSRARAGWRRRTARLARAMGFATRAEVRELEATVRALQAALDELRESDAARSAAK